MTLGDSIGRKKTPNNCCYHHAPYRKMPAAAALGIPIRAMWRHETNWIKIKKQKQFSRMNCLFGSSIMADQWPLRHKPVSQCRSCLKWDIFATAQARFRGECVQASTLLRSSSMVRGVFAILEADKIAKWRESRMAFKKRDSAAESSYRRSTTEKEASVLQGPTTQGGMHE
ncbi:hypothetical protein AB4037_11200 [Labrys sp. KB_33_2]|uniref:hypothetical protein n=1 Tax=Labrys sp. KB_33_2 TaxID=3237479 RepID=UPI003F91F29F